MESIPARDVIHKAKLAGLKFITPTLLAQLTGRPISNTLYKMLFRLEKYGFLTRLDKGRYFLSDTHPEQFEIANFLVSPSYISLETALNFHGLLSQFPYLVTSVTPLKSHRVVYHQQEFEYSHINPSLFWGYEPVGNFLIATPEKALVDQIYLASKGLRSIDVPELDLTSINRAQLHQYVARVKYTPFQKLTSKHKLDA